MTRVYNLSTGEELSYTLEPVQAVIAAYAQETCRDFNTWDYALRYKSKVVNGKRSVSCGDWCALKEEN
jgi:hypothetical protein